MQWLNWYAWLALGSVMFGALRVWFGGLYLFLTRGEHSAWRNYLHDAPRPHDSLATLRALFVRPMRKFHLRAHPVWTFGCWCYHAAILTVMSAYALGLLCLLVRAFEGRAYPELVANPTAGKLLQALLLIFGSGEPAAAQFLFGGWSRLFVWLGWWELGLAMAGNLALVTAWASHGMGAVVRDLDATCRGVLIPGRRSASHLGIRLLVFLIIQTEWLGRMGLLAWSTKLHTFLGLTLLLIAPFSYLAHTYWAPIALLSAWRRHRLGITA